MKYNLKNIKLFGCHGVYQNEKKEGQNFIINVYYEDIDKVLNDDISNVVDYSKILIDIKDVFNSKRYNLIEKLAYDIGDKIKNTYHTLINIQVKITKHSPDGCKEIESISVNYDV